MSGANRAVESGDGSGSSSDLGANSYELVIGATSRWLRQWAQHPPPRENIIIALANLSENHRHKLRASARFIVVVCNTRLAPTYETYFRRVYPRAPSPSTQPATSSTAILTAALEEVAVGNLSADGLIPNLGIYRSDYIVDAILDGRWITRDTCRLLRKAAENLRECIQSFPSSIMGERCLERDAEVEMHGLATLFWRLPRPILYWNIRRLSREHRDAICTFARFIHITFLYNDNK